MRKLITLARHPVIGKVTLICMVFFLMLQNAQAQDIVFLEPEISGNSPEDRGALSVVSRALMDHFADRNIPAISLSDIRVMNDIREYFSSEKIDYYASADLEISRYGISATLKYFATGIDVDPDNPHPREIAHHNVVMSADNYQDIQQKLKSEVLYQFIKVIIFHSQRSSKDIVVATCFYPYSGESSVVNTSMEVTTQYHRALRQASFGDRYAILGIDALDEYRSICIDQRGGVAQGLRDAYDHHISGFVLGNGPQLRVHWKTPSNDEEQSLRINGRNLSAREIVNAVVIAVTEMAPTN